MDLDLIPHPDYPSDIVAAVRVGLERNAPGSFHLRYRVTAPIDGLELPSPARPARTDGLWKTSCFELFLRPKRQHSYLEFNFSPSSQWAAYRFSDYREGMSPLIVREEPQIHLSAASDLLDAEVDLALELGDEPWVVALSAIVEEQGGRKSYWALAHPPGPPNFHHPDCFVLDLQPPSEP